MTTLRNILKKHEIDYFKLSIPEEIKLLDKNILDLTVMDLYLLGESLLKNLEEPKREELKKYLDDNSTLDVMVQTICERANHLGINLFK